MTSNSGNDELAGLKALICSWVQLPSDIPDSEDDFTARIDVLERVLEIARLATGKVVNRTRMIDVMNAGLSVDLAAGVVSLSPSGPLRLDTVQWPAPNERMPSELQIPLLLYLFLQYRRPEPIHKTIEGFVISLRNYLTPFDVESTITGVPRIMTNARVAANTLREWGLLQGSSRVRYKSWELTHIGLLAGAALIRSPDGTHQSIRALRMSHSKHLATPIMDVIRSLSRAENLVPTLAAITRENADVLDSLGCIHELLQKYAALLPISGAVDNFKFSNEAAKELLKQIAEVIPVDSLADDLAKDYAIRDVLGL
jgi:hypothetical protein